MSYCQVADNFCDHTMYIYLDIIFHVKNSVSMNIRQVNKMINQELSLLTKRNIYVGGDTPARDVRYEIESDQS